MRTPGLALLLTCFALTGCSDTGRAASGTGLDVEAAFYPLEYLARVVGGREVRVSGLTKPGAEPHDLELTPRQVAALDQADLVLLLKGFQPAVDEAVEQQGSPTLDVASVQPLERGYVPIEEGVLVEDEKGLDPHMWLDPTRFAALADAVATRFAELDPAGEAGYKGRAVALKGELATLDKEFRVGLASCTRKELVTSHNAFGYLARAYGLEQVAITGLTPEEEPTPGRLAEVARFAKQRGVTTIFFEDLVSPRTAESLAKEVGADAVVLSPIESRPPSGDYLSQMRLNLTALRTALECS